MAGRLGFSPELVPLMFVKMFSSSAATGLVLDIFKNHGPDSLIGLTTSIMMSCTETIFYHHERILSCGKSHQNASHFKGRAACHVCGDCGEHCAGGKTGGIKAFDLCRKRRYSGMGRI